MVFKAGDPDPFIRFPGLSAQLQQKITGAGAKLIKDDCEFIDNYVPDLVIKGIVLAYRKYIEEKK